MTGSEGESDSDADTPHEPSERKLAEARRNGDLPFSADLVGAGGYLGMAVFAVLGGAWATATAGGVVQSLLAHGLRDVHVVEDLSPLLRAALLALVLPVAGWFAFPAAAALVTVIAQGGQVFAPSRLAPRLRKISPVATMRQRFGAAGLVEFAKGIVKTILFAVVLGHHIWRKRDILLTTATLDPRQSIPLMFRFVAEMAMVAAAVAIVIGLLDLLWQRLHHLSRHRMSRKELEDEFREAEGDPLLKSQRRQAAVAIAMNPSVAEVRKATVVIVNPTHYAVALVWDRNGNRAPVCVAKGVDDTAFVIRRIAQEAGVPVRSDPPTARALYATTEVGQEIPRTAFRAVAAAIRFADKIRARKAMT